MHINSDTLQRSEEHGMSRACYLKLIDSLENNLFVVYSLLPSSHLGLHESCQLCEAMANISDELGEQIDRVIDDAFANGAIVSAWEELKPILERGKLAWRQRSPPEKVGCHPSNRSGEGVTAMRVHHHGYEICMQGWSWGKAADAVAVECSSNDEDAKSFNDALASVSEGMLPPVQDMCLQSISASHTNAFLRAVKSECISACPSLSDQKGRLNIEQICFNRPGLREALTSGLHWFVVSKAAVERFPKLIDLIQKSMNTRAHECQSETEVMLSMHAQALKNMDWSEIEKAAAFSNPPCKAWLHELSVFVRENGGAGQLLDDLNMFSRALCSMKGQTAAGPKKMMGSEFWTKLNSLKWPLSEKKPWVTISLVKANMASPPNKVIDGFCKLVEPRHLQQVMGKDNKALVASAEALMTDARAAVAALGLTSVQHTSLIGKLDVRCAWHIMKLGKAGEGRHFGSLTEVAQVRPSEHVSVCMYSCDYLPCTCTCTMTTDVINFRVLISRMLQHQEIRS